MPREFPVRSIGTLLNRALAVLRWEQPRAFEQIRSMLESQALTVVVDDDEFTIEADTATIVVRAADVASLAHLETDINTLLRLIDGHTGLVTALVQGSLQCRAIPRELDLLDRVVSRFLRGAVQCPSMPVLLDELRVLGPSTTDGSHGYEH